MGAASCASVRRAVNKEAVGSEEQMAVPAPGPATLRQWAGAVGRPQPHAAGSCWHMGARSKGVRAQGGGMVPSCCLPPSSSSSSSPCQHLRETFLRGWASAAVTLRWPRTLYPLK